MVLLFRPFGGFCRHHQRHALVIRHQIPGSSADFLPTPDASPRLFPCDKLRTSTQNLVLISRYPAQALTSPSPELVMIRRSNSLACFT